MISRTLGVLLIVVAAAAAGEAAAQHPETSFAGEHGLWVEEADGLLHVAWLTAFTDSGYLRLLDGERVRWETRTPPGAVHRASLPAPGRGEFALQYGGLRDPSDRNETVVRLGAAPAPGAVSIARADSIFVLGDVHGEFERLARLLQSAGVVGEDLRWTAGRRHLVFAGDLTDRGPDVNRTLWFIYDLERQAAQQGGRVHVLLGNHEIMVFTGDLRYVAPKELRLAELHGVEYDRLYDPRRSVLGRWLASKPALLRIGRALFAHGGVAPEPRYSLQAHADSLRAFMGEELFHRWSDTTYVPPLDSAAYARRYDFFWGENSVFWHRGYVLTDTLGRQLAKVLRRHGADLLVVGHTSRPRIEQRYGGTLIAAHPVRPAEEMLLLVREGKAYRRFRYTLEPGAPTRLESPPVPPPAAQ